MEDIKKEKYIENATSSVFINGIETILTQMKKCICKIYGKNEMCSTGFFCKIPFPDAQHLMPVLVTTDFAIDAEKLTTKISLNDENEFRELKLDKRKLLMNRKLNCAIIELLPDDKINDFLELDESVFKGMGAEVDEFYYRKKSVYLLQYLRGEKVAMNSGTIKRKDDNKIMHLCNTEMGSSGAPILLLDNCKVLGFHLGSSKQFDENFGILLQFPINEFNKKNVGH